MSVRFGDIASTLGLVVDCRDYHRLLKRVRSLVRDGLLVTTTCARMLLLTRRLRDWAQQD